MYRVEVSPRARRELKRLPRVTQRRIVTRLEALAEDPRPAGCTKLGGAGGLYRVREGDYRLIYAVIDEALIVLALSVAHRREVYAQLAELEKLARRLARGLDDESP